MANYTSEDVARLVIEVQGSQSLEQAQEAAEKLAATMGGPGGGTKGGGFNLQQSAQAASYAFQDFASAGGDLGQKLNSILNNIPGILSGLGSLATGVGVVATAAVVLYRNWDTLVRYFEEKRPFEDTTANLAVMKDQLSDVEKEMKKLAENTSLTATEQARFNELRAEAANIEKAIADQTERQKDIKAAEEAKAPTVEKERRERAAMVSEAIGPVAPQVIGQVAETLRTRERGILRDQYQALYEGASAAAGRGDAAEARRLMDEADKIQARIEGDVEVTPMQLERAKVAVGGAIRGGAPELARLRDLIGGVTAEFTPLGAALREATPERFAERAAEERDVKQQTTMAKLEATRKQHEEQRRAKEVQANMALSAAIDREDEQKKRHEEIAERHRQVEAHKAEQHRQVEAHKAQTKHNQEVKREAAVAEQRFGKTAELMAERGLVGGMTEAQVQGELSRRLGASGVGREAAQEAATKATNVAMGKLVDLGGRGSELLRMNTEMTRQMAERLHQQERAIQEAEQNLRAANQTNRKTGN